MKRWALLWWLTVAFAVGVLVAEVVGYGWGPVISWNDIGVGLLVILNVLGALAGG